MSTKVKRTPLFGHDGNLGIPIIPRDTKVIVTNTCYLVKHNSPILLFNAQIIPRDTKVIAKNVTKYLLHILQNIILQYCNLFPKITQAFVEHF